MNAILLELTQTAWLLASKQLIDIECLNECYTFKDKTESQLISIQTINEH